MRRSLPVLLGLTLAAVGCNTEPATDDTPATMEVETATSGVAAEQEVFWSRLQELCGTAYEGTVIDGPPGDTVFAGHTLTMHVRHCEENEIQIPFHVGENHSRTWVLTRTADGLRLKHDHRHEDGSEDEITQYGGDTRDSGSETSQEFHADAHTADLIPAASTNVWTMAVQPGRTFTYALRRGDDLRIHVDFDLSNPVTPPPTPWGY
jgi:hypothetical protein